jgi:hypothetical protein
MGCRGEQHHLRGMSEDACRGIELTVDAQ